MKRPKFSEIYAKTVNYVEQMAGYLEMNFNSANIHNEGTIVISNVNANMDDDIQADVDDYNIDVDMDHTIEPPATNSGSLLSAPGPLCGDDRLSNFSVSDTSNF